MLVVPCNLPHEQEQATLEYQNSNVKCIEPVLAAFNLLDVLFCLLAKGQLEEAGNLEIVRRKHPVNTVEEEKAHAACSPVRLGRLVTV